MNRRRADTVVGLLVAAIVVGGVGLTWQAYQRQQAVGQMGMMMDSSMRMVPGTNPLWYVLGTVFVSVLVAGGYLVVRDDLGDTAGAERSRSEVTSPTDRETADHEMADPETTEPPEGATRSADPVSPESQPQSRVLDLLPEDERRILEPVLSSPGITQIELRDRSDFSKSKVSQTVSDLEKRGLLYRERQGRTYRIYPSDDLQQNQTH